MSDFGFVTIADLCDEFNIPPHKVEYVLASRRIKHCGKIGTTRVFSNEAADQIRAALRRIDEHHAALRHVGDHEPTPVPAAPTT